MGLIKEFREFAIKGNVIDLAVAVVLGGAFGAVVTSITESLIMPILSLVMGKDGVKNLSYSINGTVFPYGLFLQAVINFLLIALVLFFIIKAMNRLMRKKEVEAAAPQPLELSLSEKLLTEIRDNLTRRV
jgi:large conductance mechanosensitive channel